MNVFQIFQTTYLHPTTNEYDKILVIDRYPSGELASIVTRISRPKLSPFQTVDTQLSCSCINAFNSLAEKGRLMKVRELPQLLTFLLSHGYTVDTRLSKLIGNSAIDPGNQLVAFITTPVK